MFQLDSRATKLYLWSKLTAVDPITLVQISFDELKHCHNLNLESIINWQPLAWYHAKGFWGHYCEYWVSSPQLWKACTEDEQMWSSSSNTCIEFMTDRMTNPFIRHTKTALWQRNKAVQKIKTQTNVWYTSATYIKINAGKYGLDRFSCLISLELLCLYSWLIPWRNQAPPYTLGPSPIC